MSQNYLCHKTMNEICKNYFINSAQHCIGYQRY